MRPCRRIPLAAAASGSTWLINYMVLRAELVSFLSSPAGLIVVAITAVVLATILTAMFRGALLVARPSDGDAGSGGAVRPELRSQLS